MTKKLLCSFTCCVIAILILGCGQSGPLYLPISNATANTTVTQS
ncbi:MAG: lipoprotein [Gammaproteobacteria bacterium]|nr:lipoprotein [Gammaproteobacteria bacterium]